MNNNKNKNRYKRSYNEEIVINTESINNIDLSMEEISKQLENNDTLVLDVGNNYFNQTDDIYDKLITMGYDVRKSFKNGRNQIIVLGKGEIRG